MNWFYGINEEQFGPVEMDELILLVKRGTLKPRDLVWHEGLGDQWVEAQTIPELGFSTASVALPPQMATASAVVAVQEPPDGPAEGLLENKELTRRARASLSGFWGIGVAVALIQGLISNLVPQAIPGLGALASLIIAGPIAVGVGLVFLNIARGRSVDVGQMFEGFKCFANALGAYLLTLLFVMLWMLLLIIPGIIAGISYAMVYFILADYPDMKPMDALRLSKEMMNGYKWQYFFLGFRFIGWALLCVLTFFIGFLWLIPYMNTTYAHFYEMVRKNYRPRSDII